MRDDRRDVASFAQAVEALKPYLDQLVFVGGWAHFLYTLRPEASPLPFELLRTEDADVAAPARLPRGTQTIAECLTRAGLRKHLSSDHTLPISEYVLGEEAGGFNLEFLAPLVGGEIKRGGRHDVTTMVGGVTAQTLRYLITPTCSRGAFIAGVTPRTMPRANTHVNARILARQSIIGSLVMASWCWCGETADSSPCASRERRGRHVTIRTTVLERAAPAREMPRPGPLRELPQALRAPGPRPCRCAVSRIPAPCASAGTGRGGCRWDPACV